MKYSVFISYRREGGEGFAQMFSEKLSKKRYRVFYDIESIGAGMFDQRILREIEQTDVFLLILTKDALDRCKNEGDWVRCEITHALSQGKTIIPVFFRGFEFPVDLPAEIAQIKVYNGVDISMIDAAAKMSRSSAIHREANPSNPATPTIQTKPTASSVALPVPAVKGNASLAIEYYYLAQKPRVFKTFFFHKSKYVCKYKRDYYYLMAAELGHREALQYIVDNKIATYKQDLSPFSYEDRSLNYARVKFLSVRSTINNFLYSSSVTDNERWHLWSRITDTLDELVRLGYVPAQIVMYQIHSKARWVLRQNSVEVGNWLYKNQKRRPEEASRLAAQLKQKGIIV